MLTTLIVVGLVALAEALHHHRAGVPHGQTA